VALMKHDPDFYMAEFISIQSDAVSIASDWVNGKLDTYLNDWADLFEITPEIKRVIQMAFATGAIEAASQMRESGTLHARYQVRN
jgi:hypothetical protein